MPATSDPAKSSVISWPGHIQGQPIPGTTIALTLWLSATQAKPFLASDDRRKPLRLLFLSSKPDNEWAADRVATSQGPNGPERSTACYLIHGDEIVEAVPLAGSDTTR